MSFGSDSNQTMGGLPGKLIWVTLAAGLVLSMASGMKICSDMCREAATYTLFGREFAWFGIAYFTSALAIMGFRNRSGALDGLLRSWLGAGVGAEAWLIWIQKYEIGTWCPICLAVAVSVTLAFLSAIVQAPMQIETSGGNMKSGMLRAVRLLFAILAGLSIAVFGVQKQSDAAELDIFLGKRKSDTTVYVVSDWFCPVCRKLEPEIEKIYAELKGGVRFAFADMPIHPESANFTPYHLQFMLYEKEKYLQLRKALSNLSLNTKSPTPEQVQAAVTPSGVTLKTQNFMEMLNGVRQFEAIYKGFKVTGTPTVIVDNPRTKKRRVLVGGGEVSRASVVSAVAEVGK